jgi:hypothetical protein
MSGGLGRGLRRTAAMAMIAGLAGSALAMLPGSAAQAAGCTPRTGPHQRHIEAALRLPVDGKASKADCLAVQKFQIRYDIRPAAGYAGPLTYSVVRRLQTANIKGCSAPRSGRKVCIDLTSQTLWVLDGKKKIHGPVPIRSGRPGYRTPTGTYRIGNKKIDTISTIYKVRMPYWQQFNGGIGLHQTPTYLYASGIPGSHGCINMLKADARGVYSLTKVGNPVQVIGRKPGT